MKIKCFRYDCEFHSLLDTTGCNKFNHAVLVTDEGMKCYDYKKKNDDDT